MILLLDECVDERLRTRIPGHEVFTIRYRGWSGIKNGRLLRLAAAEGFDALLTGDSSIRYQHNLDALPLSIVWLNAESNNVRHLLPLVPSLLAVLDTLPPRTFASVP